MARVISNGGGFYGPCAYVEEARRLKVEIQPPCVVHGVWDTKRTTHHSFRLGFQLIRGIHRRTMTRIIRERDRQAFIGVVDFWRRSRASVAEMQVLLWAGAFDQLLAAHPSAARFWLVDHALQQSRAYLDDEPDQLEFDFSAETRADPLPPTDLAPIPQRALDRHAWDAIGIVPRAHPFVLWDVPRARRWFCHDVQPSMQRRTITLVAWVITSKQVLSTQTKARDGRTLAKPEIRSMAFVTLEDDHGIAESVWFPDVYHAHGAVITAGKPFWITGKVMVEFGVATLEVTHVELLRG